MSLIGRLFDQLRLGGSPKRQFTPAEVRRLIEQRLWDEAEQSIERLGPETVNREAHVHAFRGELAFHRHQDQAAEEQYRRSLDLDASLPDSHYGLSLLFHSRGDKESALRHVLFAINGDRNQARFHAQAGLCQLSRR
jgi:thioredoxin-like negative regulator of GroEL